MSDAAELARNIVPILVPAVPYLLRTAGFAWEEASKKMGEDVWELAKAIWTRSLDHIKSKPGGEKKVDELLKTATDLSVDLADRDAQAAFRFQIKRLLTEDPELLMEIEKILNYLDPEKNISIRIGGVNISEGSTVVNLGGNIVGGNQTLGV